jgi:hypothetical protein
VNAAPAALNFRLTVRDNRPGGAGIGSADTKLVLAPTAGPFLVTSQTAADSLPAGSTTAVTWDVAGTNALPVGTTDGKVSLSTDGGLTYPQVLAASTPNDGSQTLEVPNVDTAKARIKVEAVGNVFFDVSAIDFTVRSAATQLTELAAYSKGRGPGKSLENKVKEASASLGAGNVASTCSKLQELLDLIRAQAGKSLSAAEVAELRTRIGWIRAAIDC